MIKNLVVFGDSTTQGSELKSTEQCYGELLKKKFGAEDYLNFGTPAAGPQHLVIQFKNFLKHVPCEILNTYTAVFWIGGQDRTVAHNNNEWVFITPQGGHAVTPSNKSYVASAAEQYFKYMHSKQLSSLHLNTSLLALQYMCSQYAINDYYLAGWQSMELWPEVNADKIYAQGKKSFYELFGLKDQIVYVEKNRNNIYITPNLTHPNQLGHQLIADTIYDFITNDI